MIGAEFRRTTRGFGGGDHPCSVEEHLEPSGHARADQYAEDRIAVPGNEQVFFTDGDDTPVVTRSFSPPAFTPHAA